MSTHRLHDAQVKPPNNMKNEQRAPSLASSNNVPSPNLSTPRLRIHQGWQTSLGTAALLLCLGLAPVAHAALKTWNGAALNGGLWSNPTNWSGTALVTGDDLLFTGTTRLLNTNDIVLFNLNSIAYNSSGFFTSFFTNGPGYAIVITNGIMDTAGNNTNNLAMTLGGSQSFSNLAGGNFLVLGGAINMSTQSLTFGGSGNINLTAIVSGLSNNAVTVNDGIIRLAGANTFTGPVTINSGTLQLGNAGGIPSGAGKGNVTVGAGGALDLGNTSPTINGLNGAGIVDQNPTTNVSNLTITLGAGNSNGVFSGTIANTRGTVSVIKTGTGSQVFTTPQNYVGATTVTGGGVLAVTNGGSIFSTNITIGAASSLIFDNPNSIPNNSFTVNMTVAPTGVLDFSRANASGGYSFFGNLSAGRASAFATDIAGNLTISGGNVTMLPGVAGTLTLNGDLTCGSQRPDQCHRNAEPQ